MIGVSEDTHLNLLLVCIILQLPQKNNNKYLTGKINIATYTHCLPRKHFPCMKINICSLCSISYWVILYSVIIAHSYILQNGIDMTHCPWSPLLEIHVLLSPQYLKINLNMVSSSSSLLLSPGQHSQIFQKLEP